MAVSKQPSITPETSSGEGLDEEPTSRGEAKWKRFHPLRVVRKIFRRRIKRDGNNVVSDTSKKSWSTSELQRVHDDSIGKCDVTSPLKIGLSVSHDSIFSPENSNSNIVNNDTLEVPHVSSLSVCHTAMKNMFKDELFIRIQARRDSEDDGIDMPSSPYSSPTTVDVLNQGFKEKLPKSQITYSVGSLLSMESSENDEDSTGHSSGHSSRMSLLDRRSIDSDVDIENSNPAPLNHTAAHHKIAVRPKRTYGLPRHRMKQVAAAKVISLPSTPEITEDMKRQKFDIINTESTFEFTSGTTCSLVEGSSTEQHTSYDSSCILTTEISQFTSDVQETVRKANLESFDSKIDAPIRSISDSNLNPHLLDSVKKIFKNESQFENKIESERIKPDIDNFVNIKKNLTGKSQENEMESYKLIKNTLQSKSTFEEQGDTFIVSEEADINIASFAKSIKKSNSLKNTEKNTKIFDETKHKFEKNLEDLSKKVNFEEIKLQNTETLKSGGKETNTVDEFSSNSTSCVESDSPKMVSVAENLDIDSEFVLKSIKKDRFSVDNNSCSKNVSSTYFEEESIMSTKLLSIGREENQLSVSHHTSCSGDLDDVLVTEAHNYITVCKKSKSPSFSEDRISNKEKEMIQPLTSSAEILTPEKDDSNFSLTQLSDKSISNEKITISVNTKLDISKLKLFSNNNKDMPEVSISKSTTKIESLNTPQKVEEKQLKSVNKSHLPDIGSQTVSVQNSNSQKRVSVEIVPFSQRMKERKYQPISFENKEGSLENKKKPSVHIERKHSDSKLPKNKEVEKVNNRHSFSGPILSDSEKDCSSTIREVKKEKLKYPVQIRIHKSSTKPEVKEKACISLSESAELKKSKKDKSDNLHLRNSAKLVQKEIKHKSEDKTQESTPKWEIKIQPATSHVSTSQMKNAEENNLPVKNIIQRSESFKIAQTTSIENKDIDFECTGNKTPENNSKSKEVSTLPDDPEPELLRVFARRSIKQKHCDKNKSDEGENPSISTVPDPINEAPVKNREISNISLNSTVIQISENTKSYVTKPDLKKKSKSFCEKEKVVPRSVSPLKEINLIHRDSAHSSTTIENLHTKHKLPKSDDGQLNSTLENEKKNINKRSQSDCIEESSIHLLSTEEQLNKTSSILTTTNTSINGSYNIGMVKENQDMLAVKDGHTPAWLQLAQQRREMREQRERLLLGGSPNSFMDGSSKPSRSSKVWDMVNNFQKLQMT